METLIKEYLGQIKVGRKQSYKNLALFPLLSEYEVGGPLAERPPPSVQSD